MGSLYRPHTCKKKNTLSRQLAFEPYKQPGGNYTISHRSKPSHAEKHNNLGKNNFSCAMDILKFEASDLQEGTWSHPSNHALHCKSTCAMCYNQTIVSMQEDANIALL